MFGSLFGANKPTLIDAAKLKTAIITLQAAPQR
jgi:hypothetical protein